MRVSSIRLLRTSNTKSIPHEHTVRAHSTAETIVLTTTSIAVNTCTPTAGPPRFDRPQLSSTGVRLGPGYCDPCWSELLITGFARTHFPQSSCVRISLLVLLAFVAYRRLLGDHGPKNSNIDIVVLETPDGSAAT